MYLGFFILFCVHLCIAAVHEIKTYKDYKIYEVSGKNGDLYTFIKFMLQSHEIPYAVNRDSGYEIMVAPELISIFETELKNRKFKAKVLVEDYSKIIENELRTRTGGQFSWTEYHDVDDIYNFLETTHKSHEDLTEVIVGGKTYEGRKILGLRINTPSEDEYKPVIFIESGIHAREWITPATTTYFINQLLTSSNPDIIGMRDQFDWRIFPTVNPDGYHHSLKFDRMWRKTRSKTSNPLCRGADPNRNWDYNWLEHGATNNPCDYQTYGGSKPFSEIETKTLSEYISRIENLTAYIAFHADAQLLLLPYSDSMEHVNNYDDLVQIGKTSLDYGSQVNGVKYRGLGTAAETLYKASGGSMDWVRHTMGTPIVYTYELRGKYFSWPPERIFEQGDEVTQMMLGLVEEARSLGYV